MNQLVPFPGDNRAQLRFVEFFTANIRNRNTRRAYANGHELTRGVFSVLEDMFVSVVPDDLAPTSEAT